MKRSVILLVCVALLAGCGSNAVSGTEMTSEAENETAEIVSEAEAEPQTEQETETEPAETEFSPIIRVQESYELEDVGTLTLATALLEDYSERMEISAVIRDELKASIVFDFFFPMVTDEDPAINTEFILFSNSGYVNCVYGNFYGMEKGTVVQGIPGWVLPDEADKDTDEYRQDKEKIDLWLYDSMIDFAGKLDTV